MSTEERVILQAAAIPLRDEQVCLITSSNGKRWVVPKGIIDPGQTPGECALNEAWEEAGLVGVLEADTVGEYSYPKWGSICQVTVFVMRVTEAAATWPEQAARKREWVSPTEALERVSDASLLRILREALEQRGLVG